jgi:hypothetical protein
VSAWWSYALAAAALATSWLIGEKKTWAWLVAAGLQVAWMMYAVLSEQWGFLASSVVFLGMNLRNYAKWRRDDAREGEGKC